MHKSGRHSAAPEALEGRRLLAATVVGEWDFEDGAVPGNFSGGMVSATPAGARKFLETAQTTQTRTVSLAVENLPVHQSLTIAFELYVFGSWDGNTGFYAPVGRAIGPDYWGATGGTGGDQEVLFAEETFTTLSESPWNFTQSAGPPDEENTLGYFFTDSNGTFAVDMVYHVERTFDHTAAAAVFSFTGRTEGTGSGEQWGLDNVQITATDVPEPVGVGLALLGARVVMGRRGRDRSFEVGRSKLEVRS
jgi:hypothetical protein